MADRVLVTGGAGFIGSNFVHHLLENHPDCTVFNLDKLTYAGNLDNLKDIQEDSRYKFVHGDICDEDLVNNIVESGIDCIFNFAAETHVDRSILEPSAFIRTDVLGTHVLLEAARKYKVKLFIQISTDEVYGSIEEGSFREVDVLNPSSPYSASKAGAELLVKSFITTYHLPAIITRGSNNYGPFQYPEKLIPLFVTNALEDKPLPMYGDGLNVRDWLFVRDHCEALDTIREKGVPGEIYNVGGSNERTNIEITKCILSQLDKPESLIQTIKDRPGHDRRYSIDCGKLKSLGWKPRYDFNLGMQTTIDWYRKNLEWWQKLKVKNAEFKAYYEKWYSDNLGMKK